MVSAVQKSYRKNILREMKGNASRMVSLFGIVALGVMMLTGLMSIAPSMRSAAQKYYVQQNVFDLRVLSTLGLSDQDIAAIAATPGVEAVMPVKTLDLEANWQGQEERIVVQLQALQQDPAADTDANMNRLVLRSGRMPQAANECVVHVMGYQAEIAEGTVLTLPEDTEGTKHKEYTVVGLVQDPQHISTDKESSTVGNGQLNYIAYVLDGELTADYYTACYIKAENAGQYDNYSQEYQEAVDQVADRLEQISTAQCVQRREQLIDTANQKLAEARQTYDDQKAEAEQKIAELQSFISRFAANKSKSRQATSRRKLLDKLTVEEMPASGRRYPWVGFKADREPGKDRLFVTEVSKTVDGVKLLNNISFIVGKEDKIAILGKNELAVTMLFKILMGEEEPDSGTVKWGASTTQAYFPKDHNSFFENCDYDLMDWMRQFSEDKRESYLRTFLGRMLFSGDDVYKPVKVLSGGEKVRGMISKMMLSGANFLVLDQPTNHLDLESIAALNNGLEAFKYNIIFSSHDHQLTQTVANRIIEITDDGIIDRMCSFDEYMNLTGGTIPER